MNLSWLIYESIKALEIKIQKIFSLSFASNAIYDVFFLFFFIIDLNFLIPLLTVHKFNATAKLVILTEIPANKTKAEMERHPVTAEIRKRKRLK